MKKTILSAIVAALALPAGAQTALDAYSLSQNDLRGTARFMSMAGAFTALGGDLSTLGQNPGGIGIYRNSEIGATLDVDFMKTKAGEGNNTLPTTWTKASCSNFGYIGSVSLGSQSVMPYFNWGVTYGRVASFDRKYRGNIPTLNGSLTNYVANYTAHDFDDGTGWPTKDLNGWGTGDVFRNTYAPWMSILMYSAYGINPSNVNSTDYKGLYNGTPGSGTFDVLERGYIDEYNINFGGNILNTVFWGMGFGITDIDYTNNTYYGESFTDATISNPEATGRTTGTAQLGLSSWKHIYGTGFNFKVGVIVKPINELRLGFSIHTPTYYNLNYDAEAWVDYHYTYPNIADQRPLSGSFPNNSTYDSYDYFSWDLRTPWRMMFGVAGVIGGQAIVSADYEYRPMGSMRVEDQYGNEYINETGDVKSYYKDVNILRLGAEYRINSHVSVRAGYSYQSSPSTTEFKNNDLAVYTSGPDDTGMQPSFTIDNETQYITCGLGYRYKNFYADAAYVYRTKSAEWQAYTSYQPYGTVDWVEGPRCKISDNDSRLVISMGVKF